jgi:hypothetical protein
MVNDYRGGWGDGGSSGVVAIHLVVEARRRRSTTDRVGQTSGGLLSTVGATRIIKLVRVVVDGGWKTRRRASCQLG